MINYNRKMKKTTHVNISVYAVLAAMTAAVFAANADDTHHDWTGASVSTAKYWDDAANWKGGDGSYRFFTDAGSPTVIFRGAASIAKATKLYVENLSLTKPVVFKAASSSCGIASGFTMLTIGTGNAGSLEIDGGTYVFESPMQVARNEWGANASGALHLKNGLLAVPGMYLGGMNNGANPTSLATVSGGRLFSTEDAFLGGNHSVGGHAELTVEGAGTVSIGSDAAHKWLKMTNGAILNLNGGTLDICSVRAEHDGAAVNLNGGTIHVYAYNGNAAGNIIQANAAPAVNVLAGGAVVDTAFDVAIAVPLRAGTPSDGGLVKRGSGALMLAAGNSYNGPTVVEGGLLNLPEGAFASGEGGALVLKGGGIAGAPCRWASVAVAAGDYDFAALPAASAYSMSGGRLSISADAPLVRLPAALSATGGRLVLDAAGVYGPDESGEVVFEGVTLDAGRVDELVEIARTGCDGHIWSVRAEKTAVVLVCRKAVSGLFMVLP